VIAGKWRVQHRRLAPGRPGADHCWQRIEGRLIDPDNRAALLLGFALSAGHRLVLQRSIAASSRCVARRIGF
jgi:hypothetical protein